MPEGGATGGEGGGLTAEATPSQAASLEDNIAPSDAASTEAPDGASTSSGEEPDAPERGAAGGGAAATPTAASAVPPAPEQPSPGAPHPTPARAGHQLLKTIHINLAACKYSVLRIVARKLGWVEVGDDAPWQVCWTDTSSGTERLMRLRRPQKLNHFPGMLEIARKKSLARNLGRMAAAFPRHYDFSPRTFLLPEQLEPFLAELGGRGGSRSGGAGARGPRTFIMKLDNGSQGRGIKLVQSTAAALEAIPTFEHENIVASQYIANPFLVEGLKFDLRIYVLVRCCDPLRAFIHTEGLARFCTEHYQPPAATNLANVYAHLTNYAVNKKNPHFIFNKDAQQDGDGSKWSITALADWMQRQGHDWAAIWASIKHMIAKSLVAVQPILQYHYAAATKPDDDGLSCFEVLGYDVLLDESLRPWLLEVNHSPSFTVDTPLDLAIKERLITETMALVGINVGRYREELAAREAAKQHRLYSAAPFPGSPTAAAVAAGGDRAGAVSPSPGHRHHHQQQHQPATAPEAEPGGGHAPGGRQAAGPAAAGVGAAADWEAAQRQHEDANLGHFERILPSDDPQQQALYEELRAGAQQVFFKQTMQGRLQHALLQIKERRHQEEAEAAAREEAQRRRAESLKAWMASVYAKTQQERARQAQRAQQEREEELLQACEAEGVADGLRLSKEPAACCASRPASACARLGDPRSPSPALQRTDTARTRSSQGEAEAAGQASSEHSDSALGSSGSGAADGQAAAGRPPVEALNIQGVRQSMRAAPASVRRSARAPGGTASCPTSPTAPPAAASQPRYAWRNKPGVAGSGGASGGGVAAPVGKPAFSPSIGSGRFVRRIAAMGHASSHAPASQPLGSTDSSEGGSLGLEGGGGDSAEEWLPQGPTAELASPRTYIPPAMLSALHSVSLQLGGSPPAGQCAAGEAAAAARLLQLPSAAPPAATCYSPQRRPGLWAAAQRGGSPALSRSTSRGSRSLTPVAARGTSYGQPASSPSPAAHCAPAPAALAARQQQQLLRQQRAAAGAAAGTGAAPGRGQASRSASLQREYVRQIEKLAVKSIADMIADVLGK